MNKTNLDLWNTYGDHLVPVMPFLDDIIVRQEGSYIFDVEGNRTLDLAAGQFCTIIGHNHPEFIARITAELQRTLHTGSQYVSEPVLRAAKKVADIAPPTLDNVIFLSTGSEANEFAVRVAKLCKNKSGIAGFDRGYYGITLGTRSLSSISSGHIDFSPRVADTFQIVSPNPRTCCKQCTSCDLTCLHQSLQLFEDQWDNIAAVIIEPVVSAGGMIFPSREYLAALEDFCRYIDAFIIVDEAQTGFGRCGTWFDTENLGINPDILVFSKTSGNGYPSSGVIISDRIKERLLDKGFHHLSSHQNDPIAATAVEAVIDIIRANNYIDECKINGEYFLDKLRSLEERHTNVCNARGRGLMLAFDVVKSKGSNEPYQEMIMPFILACKKLGVHVTSSYYNGAIRVIPSMTLSRDEIDFSLDVFDQALTSLEKGELKSVGNEPRNAVYQKMSNRSEFRKKLVRMMETSPRHWLKRINPRRPG